MSVRTELAALLKTALPTFRVVGYPTSPDAITRPTVLLWQTKVVRLPAAPEGAWLVDLDLWVVVGTEDPATCDDDLDTALELVVEAIDPMPAIIWDTAERLTLLDKWQGYKISARAVGRNGTP
jgi:hypothetical protein